MNAFSTAWLDLREDFDHRARSFGIDQALCAWAAQRKQRPLRIVDLGCGTGSNLRYLGPRLPLPQSWLLIDHDEALLAEARRRLPPVPGLAADIRRRDLARLPLSDVVDGVDLVTTAALLDLVSANWLHALVGAIAAPTALLAVLTYAGSVRIDPADVDDVTVLAAFDRHQETDKGFGPALGSGAADALRELASRAGAHVVHDDSPWRLDHAAAAMQAALIDGWATAAVEMAPDQGSRIAAWRRRRLDQAAAGALTMGVRHVDVLAIWS